MVELNIRDIVGLNKVGGDVGVEIEMEGNCRFPWEISKYWKAEEDGSLRGYSVEYVMRQPMELKKVKSALNLLKEEMAAYGARPVYSERAGVHVHVNVQELTLKQVISTALVYYCLEHALVRYCGENREGNHFCLRAEDAGFIIDAVESVIQRGRMNALNNEDIRYASLNFCSLVKYGSLEFRSMETQPDLSKILEWSTMLVSLRDYAKDLKDYTEIPTDISAYGPTGWARKVLGEEMFNLINYPEFDRDVMRCVRPIQHLFYMKGKL